MLFTLRKAKKVKMDGFTAFLYNSKSEFPVVSNVYVDCHKGHEKVYVKNIYRLYFVLKGKGNFKVGKKKCNVKPRDVVIIPPRTEYSYQDKMELFESNFPATGPEDEVAVN